MAQGRDGAPGLFRSGAPSPGGSSGEIVHRRDGGAQLPSLGFARTYPKLAESWSIIATRRSMASADQRSDKFTSPRTKIRFRRGRGASIRIPPLSPVDAVLSYMRKPKAGLLEPGDSGRSRLSGGAVVAPPTAPRATVRRRSQVPRKAPRWLQAFGMSRKPSFASLHKTSPSRGFPLQAKGIVHPSRLCQT